MANLTPFPLLLVFLFATGIANAQPADTARHWLHQLPACPCRNPDYQGVKLHDGWARDKGDLHKYHRGAAASFRSYPAVKTQWGYSCQQCCYDSAGDLITAGRGAGTPDKISACKGENNAGKMTIRLFGLIGHYFKDVRPWKRYMHAGSTGWQQYNAIWIPDPGKGCTLNTVPR